jgi:hypothetical protein
VERTVIAEQQRVEASNSEEMVQVIKVLADAKEA